MSGRTEGLQGTPDRLLQIAEAIFLAHNSDDWYGRDPYDALLSPLARRTKSKLGRQLWTQGVKRSPIDLRGILRTPTVRTAAALGMAASAAARLDAWREWRARSRSLAALALESRLDGRYQGLWGYEFDVQTRWGYYPRGLPNIVATTFAFDGVASTGSWTAEGLSGFAEALLDHLYREPIFIYTPGSTAFIHNANLMGAALALSLAGSTRLSYGLRARLREAGTTAALASTKGQRRDGSWPYGEEVNLGWVDGFHTAYVLIRLEQVAAGGMTEVQPTIDRGAAYYFDRLFEDSSPLYLPGKPRRKDGNNAATGLRMAAWGARRGHVSWRFANSVSERVEDEGWVAAAMGRKDPRVRANLVSPRWLGAPMLDAVTAWAVEGEHVQG